MMVGMDGWGAVSYQHSMRAKIRALCRNPATPVQLCRATLGAARIPPLMPRPGARPGSSGRVACILSDPSLCAV